MPLVTGTIAASTMKNARKTEKNETAWRRANQTAQSSAAENTKTNARCVQENGNVPFAYCAALITVRIVDGGIHGQAIAYPAHGTTAKPLQDNFDRLAIFANT